MNTDTPRQIEIATQNGYASKKVQAQSGSNQDTSRDDLKEPPTSGSYLLESDSSFYGKECGQASSERKRKMLEETIEELQGERERLREKNRTNSQRFRDRKKDYMDNLFEEKYRLGKENNDLKADNERLKMLLSEALAENELHHLQRKRSALLESSSTRLPPFQDPAFLSGCPPFDTARLAGLSPYGGGGFGPVPSAATAVGGVGAPSKEMMLSGGMMARGASLLPPGLSPGLSAPSQLNGAAAHPFFFGASLGGKMGGVLRGQSMLPQSMGMFGGINERHERFRAQELGGVVMPEDVSS